MGEEPGAISCREKGSCRGKDPAREGGRERVNRGRERISVFLCIVYTFRTGLETSHVIPY